MMYYLTFIEEGKKILEIKVIQCFFTWGINGLFNWKMHVRYFIFFNVIISEKVEGLDIYKEKIVLCFKCTCNSIEFGSIF